MTTATSSNTGATNTSHPHCHRPSSATSQPATQACAACKYQRRRCKPDCTLAPYFPADQQRQFLNAHRLFGVSNILKIIRDLDPLQRTEAMRSIIFQSNARAHDPVGGCYRIILELERQLEQDSAELALVLRQLAICRSQAQAALSPTMTTAVASDLGDVHPNLILNADDTGGPISNFVQQLSKSSNVHPWARRTLLSATSGPPPNGTDLKLEPSGVLAPPILPPLEPLSTELAVPRKSIASPVIQGNEYGMHTGAPPKELSSRSTQANYSYPKGTAVSPTSGTSTIHGHGYSIPVAAPLDESSSHLSPVNHSHSKGPAVSPASITSPADHGNRYGMPVAAPATESSSNLSPVNYSHPKGPAISLTSITSPTTHGNRYSMPVAAAPTESSSHLSPVNYLHPKGPAVSPASINSPANHGNRYGMPVAASPTESFSHLSPVNYSHPKGPAVSPTSITSPANHGNSYGIPVAAPPTESSSNLPPINHSLPKGPAVSPAPATSSVTHGRYGMPVAPPPRHISSPLSPKNYSHRKGSFPVISPAQHEADVPSNTAHAPSNSHPQPPMERILHGFAPVPVVSLHQPKARKRTGNPTSASPESHNPGPVQSPVLSPSGSASGKPRAPQLQPVHSLPPPPPNLEPFTNSPPGSPCACVMPIRVGLRLSIALYTFFPLVSELAQEIAYGLLMKQSQIRIMGANAASEDYDKTVALIDLVPFGDNFDNATAFLVYEKFWHKQVFINPSYFGDYDVLYVLFPGLPPSPPTAPGNVNVDNEAYGSDNNSRRIHPLGVDVRKQKEKQSGTVIAIIVLSAVIALVLCVGAAWLFLLKHREISHLPKPASQISLPSFAKASGGSGHTISGSRPTSASTSFNSSIATCAGSAKSFSLAEVERATNKFEDSRIIGEGGFGRVYEGTLEDGRRVAIKVLKRDDQQGSREFLAEVEMLSRLHHRNLVKLIGICTEEHFRCLVCELVPNGSVESHLHGVDKDGAPLDWNARLKIALGAARGLAYLHEDSSPRVIHRDFKASNILLEHDFTPKVSDFGLARTVRDEENEHISTRVMGTFGYVAPEYAMTGHLLVKSDVYSYGVVLLELLTGRKPVDMLRPPGQENLVTWARPHLSSKGGLENVIDPSLGTIPFDSVVKVAAIASMCVQPEVNQRPFMGEVVQALKLVCNERDEHGGSGSCSQEEISTQDMEIWTGTGLDLESERVTSASDIFSTLARFTRDVSGSFRTYSSSGPLRTGWGGRFWHRLRGLSSGSASEHGRFGTDFVCCDQWV
ncbi:receptor-like serine/threonine-protein kinase ALE2 [Cocos nucifera]|nr:receptor-like serine/threonine-protein kinase ALE2 [Cocos nucifera]